jgi:acyl-CoA synthetase (AMP-forming)/AMP-acid ligase II
MAAGMTVTPVNPAYTEAELAALLEDSGASLVLERLPSLGAPAPPVSAPDDLALLPYSSGTTGLPKGVMLTHVQLVTAVRQVQAALRPTERDTLLAVAPFFHVLGFAVVLSGGLTAGARLVTLARFDLERMLALIERHRITMLVGAPPIMLALAEHPLVDRYDLSSLRFLASGGAPLAAELQAAVAARLPWAVVGQGWGMTETTVGAAVADRVLGSLPGSVGRALPNTSLRVVDPIGGGDLGPGEDGELWVRGPQLMAGYRGRPDATAAIIDADGWLHTGDLGHIDASGNVFVVDRLKELIKVSGYQVAPAELEALLISHPAVADAAVVGRPDRRLGEVPMAFVVARGDVAPLELIEWAAARTAPYKRLAEVTFVDALPRSPAGKLLRRLLVERCNGAAAPRVNAPDVIRL